MPSGKAKSRSIAKLLVLPLICLAAWAIYVVTPIHKPIDWVTLDLVKFNRLIGRHLREAHGTADYACVYTVNCASGDAMLELRTHLTQSDFEPIKATIWRRKFENYCPGRTTNFGIENSGEADAIAQGWEDYRRRDIWVDGGFIGEDGRYSGGSFAPKDSWTRCTRDKAYWTRQTGIIADSSSN